jgi:hypothetical protein
LKRSSASVLMFVRSRWVLAALSSFRCFTIPPLSNLAVVSR